MNRDDLKDVIDEIICEEIRRKNPFHVGDLVKLRPDILQIYHAGPDYNARSFYKRLEQLKDKMGKVTGLSMRGLHVTVEFEDPWDDKDEYGREYNGMKSIGVKFTDLVPYAEPVLEGVLGMLDANSIRAKVQGLVNVFNYGKMDRNTLTKKMEELMWASRTQDPEQFPILKATVDKLKTPAAQHPGIRLKFEEGVGAGNPSDDPKHIPGERWRIKFASEDDLKKHGDTEKSPVKEKKKKKDETTNPNEIKEIIQELLKEMWIGWEEEEEQKNEVAPAGWEGTVKAMKKHKEIDNPWALANWEKNQGYKSHKHENVKKK